MTDPVFTWVKRLRNLRIRFTIQRLHPNSIMRAATLVGARIETDRFKDGQIEYSIFKGDKTVESDVNERVELLRADGASPGVLPAWYPATGRPDLP